MHLRCNVSYKMKKMLNFVKFGQILAKGLVQTIFISEHKTNETIVFSLIRF